MTEAGKDTSLGHGPTGSNASFRGWLMVAVCFGTQFMVSGCIFYAFSVCLIDLADEFSGGERAPVMLLQVAGGVATAFLAPFIGRAVGKNWTRPLMTLGAVAMGLGLLGIAHAQSLWQLAALFATLVAFGGATLSGVGPATVVVNWFDRKRAMALGISQLGASLGGFVMAPILGFLVAEDGWRATYETLAMACFVAAPVIGFLLVGRPEDRGQGPDGGPPRSAAGGGASASPAFSTREALRNPNLWFIAMATGISFMATTGLLNNIVAFGSDRNFGVSEAAWLASLCALGAAIGKILFGGLSDRIGPAKAFIATLVTQAVGFSVLCLVDGFTPTLAVALFAGIGIGGTLPLSTALLARVFGREAFGPVVGLLWPIAIPLQLIGPIFAASVFDFTGSYEPAFWALAASLMVAVALIRAVRVPEIEPGSAAGAPA
ncbi:MAG: MFS transporter [Myxococcota bacterium]